MAKRKSENFLPQTFRTLSNRRFLNATIDPLIQEPSLKKMYGYIGQQDQSPVFNKDDYYINENDSYSQFYQLEPGVVIKKRQYGTNTYKVDNVYNYVDLLNQIAADGGINNNHDRLFSNRYYSYNGFIDLDKLTNYRQYYWVPGGPLTVDVTAANTPTQKDFYIHRTSYTANNQTELQSAALGATGYSVDGYNNVVNPTLTLVRGGSYNFYVNQDTEFWIQTEIGVDGVSSTQNNISTRDVLGVTDNGTKSGTVTFTVPLSTAQDYLINYTTLGQVVDLIVDDITYEQIQGQNYDSFILEYGLDGVRAFDGKYVVFKTTTGWGSVSETQWGGVWRLNVGNDPTAADYRLMNLTYIADWPVLNKVFVTQGDVYGHVYAYKDIFGTVQKFPTLSAAQSILYYVDSTNPLVYGTIQLVDPEPNSLLNVNDILGRKNYTSPNGIAFTSGLKVKFTGVVIPAEYQGNEYIVEGVGSSIKLVKYADLVTPEIINTNLGSSFGNSRGYDADGTGFDGTTNSPEQKDYVTINRSSIDGNSWSRNNRWFHRDVLQAAADYNSVSYNFDSNQQAKRPIVEFLPNLKLFNYGTNYAGPVTCVDSITTSAFAQVEGFNSYAVKTNGVYNSDGIQLLNGLTVIFTQETDPVKRATLYRIQNNKTRESATYNIYTYAFTDAGSNYINIADIGNLAIGQHVTGTGIPNYTTITSIDTVFDRVYISNNLTQDVPSGTVITFDNSYDQIHLIPIKTFNDGDTVVAMEGVTNQGNMFYYANGEWTLAQVRDSRPQFPLFDVIDKNSYSFGNQSVYPSSDFSGSKLFGYAVGTGSRDSELGFPLVYKSIGNLGDIVFENFYQTDIFNYSLNQVDQEKSINQGFGAVIVGWDNYTLANGWYRVSDKSKQYITKVFTTTNVLVNNFDLQVVYDNSYYENNIFVYVNGVLQSQANYTLKTNSITSLIAFTNDLAVGDRVFVKIYGTSAQYKETYTMPRNLTNNSENTEFTTITLGQVRNHLIEIGDNLLDLVGEPAGANNFRDLNYNYVGGKLLQHSASMRPAALLFANRDVDPMQFIRYAADSYSIFKNQLLNYITNAEFPNPTNYRDSLDMVLEEFTKVANVGQPFYYTDMIGFGTDYIKNSYTVANTTYRSFNLTQDFADDTKNYRSLLVYLNGVLLLKNVNYTIGTRTITINSTVTLLRNDLIEIYEYNNTQGCNIPATPTKLGMYPKFKPEIVTDDTYVTPTLGIIGHDGSFTKGWGDYRDNILLEFEKRVYNNITTTYSEDSDVDLSSVVPGAFRVTDYTIDEWTQLLAPQYLRWAHVNNVDIFTNNTITGNEFTFNYATGIDKLFNQPVPGYWRGIYKYFYDTEHPHTKPWEMLGFTEKPSWWQLRYGPAPYTSENGVLWNDLEAGYVYNGNPNSAYYNSRFTRPGLTSIIPVDEHGNLLNPNKSVLRNYDANYSAQNWVVGDQSPAETAWRRSVDYPFAVMMAWCLAKPAEWTALKYNTRDLAYNTLLNQFINKTNNNRQFDFTATGPSNFIPGYNVWLRDYLTSNNLDITENWINVANNSTFNLVYKMGSFTDKSYLTIVADQVSPQSTNSSVIIPQENYQVKVTKSAPVARAVYSAVIVQKVTNGYQVSGFDRERPYFLTIPSRVSNNNYSIVVGNERAIVYQDSTNNVYSYPYGSIFNTKQQVVDFLVSYGRYLESQGFVFEEFLSDNTTKSDWVLAAKEFLFWNQQQWGDDTIISLTPAGTDVKFISAFGVVDTLSNTNSYTKIVNSDNTTLNGQDYRVYRDDNLFQLELKNAQKGVHLVDLAIVQYEHTLILDNNTVFNDILYDEQVGSRQFRLRLDGAKTNDWNGSLYAPGFFVNVSEVPQWVAYTDYYKGDIVLFKSQYYAAQDFIPGTAQFNSSNWYLINGDLLSKNLIPNMASGAAQFLNFHDPDTTDLNSAADLLSKSETGFSPRQYFADLGLDNTSQYKFYLGMVSQKGTKAVLNAYLRNKQKRIDSDIKLVEQWAIKLDNYGGTNQNDKLEFNIGNSITINNQYLFEFINQNDARNTQINSVKPTDLLYKPYNYTPDIFAKTQNNKTVIPTAGPVNPNDVDATVFDINKIYNISALNSILSEGSKVWIAADSANQWGVYRLSQPGNIFVTYINQINPTELQFTTNLPHNLNQYDYVMLKNGRLAAPTTGGSVTDMSGFYRVSKVSNTTFNVKIADNTTIGTGALNAILFKLVNVRYSTVNNFANFVPVRGWNMGEIVYIDAGVDGYNVLQNSNSWVYSQTKSPVFTSPSDNFGSSVKINSTQGFAIVGASAKGGTGSAFIYGKREDNSYQEVGILTPDIGVTTFGANVDINDNNFAFASAPGAYKGVVYAANVNSQQVKLTQSIHYDNLYAISAGFSQSNASILLTTVYSFDSTGNIAQQASYSVDNFAVGMGVGGVGVNAGTVITSITTKALTNNIILKASNGNTSIYTVASTDTASILQSNSSILKTLYANITSSNSNVYIGNTGQSITGLYANGSQPVFGNGIPTGSFITAISNITGYKVLTLNNNVSITNNSLLTFARSNANVVQTGISSTVTSANNYFIVSGATSLYGAANGMPFIGGHIPNSTVISNLVVGPQYNILGVSSNVNLGASSKIAIYPNVQPTSNFGYSISASGDGKWLYVGEPTTNSVYVYKYTYVTANSSTRQGDGTQTSFTYPTGATGSANDIKVYVNGVLKIPNFDYIKTPGQDIITFEVAPSATDIIDLVYEDHYAEVNRIVTDDPDALGFGTSVSTNYDGTTVVIGAANSSVNSITTLAYSGKTYVYERTAEVFVANGVATTFQLSNALSSLTTITTPDLITHPSATVDGVDTDATFNVSANQVTFVEAPTRGSIVRVETNQFVNTLISYTDLSQEYSYYGTAVKTNNYGSVAFSGAPGYATSSSQNGAVFRLINIPKMYGNIVGNKTGFTVSANAAIRINDYLVKFGETLRPPYEPIYFDSDVDQVVTRINESAIPYVTAGKTPNGAIYITSTDSIAMPKLRLRNEGSDILGTLGISQWKMVQKLTNPIAQDTARFGEILAISPDANSMVVGSTLSNTKTTVTFDSKTTTFDRYGTKFRDTVYQSGAAHLYEYQTAANESATNYGSYAYATLIQDQFANSYDRYSSGVDISDNFLMVGAPHAHLLGNPVGAMYVYYNQNAAPVWQTIRSGGVDYDSRNINRVYLYNSTTARLIAELPVIDLPYAYLPNSSESYLDYVINYDPAVYNVAPTTISFSYDRKNAWGREQVGKLWWDINSIKYYDNTQGDNLERFNYWGLAFPASTVNVYEWVESDVLPKNYIGSSANNTPLYTINDVYSAQVSVDEKTGQAITKYYFWVKNSILANPNRPSAREIQTALISPRNNNEPFAAVLNKNAIGIFNAQNLVSIDTNLAIEYKNTLEPQLIHSEWTMFDDGTDLGVANEFLNKLNDSLTGQDSSGRIVPDYKLPIGQKYGMSVDLRQSLFKDNYYARQLFTEKINQICIKYPIVLTRSAAITELNNVDPIPDSTEYTLSVNNITELGYINVLSYPIGTQVLVLNDSNSYNNGWSLFKLVVNSTSFARRWEYVRVQTYNVNDYWTYADWYSVKYNAQSPINHTVETENDIANLTLNINDLIYVTNSNSGGWKLVLVNETDLELIAQQNATIQFTSKLYSLVDAAQGFQTNSFQSVGFDTDSNLEFNIIFSIIRDYLLTNEYRTEYKETIALLIDIVASQHQQTDWMMKTSLVDLYHRVRGLDQLPVYLPQPENTVTEFFNEVKPFHTKLKQYIAKYDNSNDIDIAYSSITDFDLQPYKNTLVNQYRSPQLGNSLDVDALTNTAVYQPWVNNHKYGIKLVTMVDGGTGYDGSTTAVVIGDGTGAIVKPYILNGSVYTIEVIHSGKDYTYATVEIYGIGSGAKAEPVIGNSLTRNINTNIKFDRNQYFNNIQDWAANTSYSVNDVIVYNATPYRCITAHTSGATFDATKFLVLIVKVWYPQTTYNINDIVVYNNTSYVVTTAFTSALTFDSANMSSYNGLWLDNACDRVWAYYAPLSGMAGRDLAQVMTGIYYTGNQVIGPGFNQVPGYDVTYYDYIPYDYATKDIENVYDIYGVQSEDTIIRSLFTDTGLGLRPEDIDVVGGGFIDTYSSHAPEELIPGQLTDTLDIKVNTLPIADGGPDIKIFTSNYIGSNTFSYDPEITGVDLPIGGIEKFYVIDRDLGPIAETYHFTVDYYAKTITVLYTPQTGTFFHVLMIGSNGVNPVTDLDYYADGTQTDFDLPDLVVTNVQQAYVKINGVKVENWSLVNTLQNGRLVLAVRFDTAPNANDYVQVHIYNVAVGTKSYSEWYEQTFVIPTASYPVNYNFTLEREELYVEPVSSYPIVRLNGSDLLPPQQSYYFGDGLTKNFNMTDSWIQTYTSIVDPEIIVVVDGITQVRNQDYTVDHGSYTAMPVIQFTNAPQSGARIVISDSSQCDFKIYGNQIWISPNVVISDNSKLTVLTQGNHDPNEQYTKLFSGDTASASVIDNGLDTTGFDTVGFDNELSSYIGSVYYTLPRAITNINQLYITLKAPNTTGGFPLLPYRDFKLVTPTIVVLDTALNISGTSVITVRIFGEPVRQHTLEFRLFKDMRDNSRIYAVKGKKATLTANLLANANYIYVDNVNYLQSPGITPNNSGIVIINGERITYGTLDRVNNRLGNLRRGTAGTGTPNLHVKGTLIYDSGSTLEIPNTRETYVQTPVETYISSGLFTSYANVYTNNIIIDRTLPLVPVVNNSANITVSISVVKNSTTLAANSDYVISANSVVINSNVNLGTYVLANITTSNGNIYISNTYTTVSNAMIGQYITGGNLFPSTTITNVSNSAPYIVIAISSPQTVNANSNIQILDTITVNQDISNKILVAANNYIRQGTLIQSFGTSLQDSTSSYAEFIRSQ